MTGLDPRVAIGFQGAPARHRRRQRGARIPPGRKKSEGAASVAHSTSSAWANTQPHRPKEISGGMAQRVSGATLARNGVLLLDRPSGALDALTRINMQDCC